MGQSTWHQAWALESLGTYMIEEEIPESERNWLLHIVFWPLYMLLGLCMPLCMNKCNFKNQRRRGFTALKHAAWWNLPDNRTLFVLSGKMTAMCHLKHLKCVFLSTWNVTKTMQRMIKVCLVWIAFNLKKPYAVERHHNEPCKCSTTWCGFQQGMLPHLKFHFGPMESEAKFIKVLGGICLHIKT